MILAGNWNKHWLLEWLTKSSLLLILLSLKLAAAEQKFVGFESGHENEIQHLFHPYKNNQVLPSGFLFEKILIDKLIISAIFTKDDAWYKIHLNPVDNKCSIDSKSFCITTSASSKKLLKEQAKEIRSIIAAIKQNDHGTAHSWLIRYDMSAGEPEIPFDYMRVLETIGSILFFIIMFYLLLNRSNSNLSFKKKVVFSCVVIIPTILPDDRVCG